MANPTTNFNWQMPTNTDLVKDLPADFEVFGQAVDTSLMDLKGGTTGQILSKASNADMDFTWIANDQGDITAVTAGTGISGGGTSGAVTITNSMATAIDAKADLIVGTGSDAFTRLAAGNNGDQLLVDSSTTTGLRWQGDFAAGKNKIINGDFSIWQRGTSFSAGNYSSDRWLNESDGTCTVTQETFTPGTAPVAGYENQFYLRQTRTATGTFQIITQRLEDVRTFAGNTITVSFWAKANANVTNSPNIVQSFGSGGSADVTTTASTQTITTSWARYSYTISVPSVSGKTIGSSSYLVIRPIRIVTGTAHTIDLWGVQAEIGNVPTSFQTATGTLQGELAACQRYYYRMGVDGNAYNAFGVAAAGSANSCNLVTFFPVPMRTSPSAIEASAASTFAAGAVTGLTAVQYNSATNTRTAYTVFTKTSAFTSLGAYAIFADNSSTAYLAWSAEL